MHLRLTVHQNGLHLALRLRPRRRRSCAALPDLRRHSDQPGQTVHVGGQIRTSGTPAAPEEVGETPSEFRVNGRHPSGVWKSEEGTPVVPGRRYTEVVTQGDGLQGKRRQSSQMGRRWLVKASRVGEGAAASQQHLRWCALRPQRLQDTGCALQPSWPQDTVGGS